MIDFKSPAVVAPDRSIIGVILQEGELVSAGATRLGPDDPVPARTGDYIIDFPLAKSDAVTKALALSRMVRLRRAGATFVLITHDEELLERCADEVWWIRDGKLLTRGDPALVLPLYRSHVAKELRRAGCGQTAALTPSTGSGDGRALLRSIEMTGSDGAPSTVFQSGEQVCIVVTVAYSAPVEEPVVGILIRTRIGLNVYGTNSELEQLKLGPVGAGEALRISYRFRCELCPGDYTVTAASHDPDGLWHDWREDAVAFAVADGRYTAGVANLRAQVSVET